MTLTCEQLVHGMVAAATKQDDAGEQIVQLAVLLYDAAHEAFVELDAAYLEGGILDGPALLRWNEEIAGRRGVWRTFSDLAAYVDGVAATYPEGASAVVGQATS